MATNLRLFARMNWLDELLGFDPARREAALLLTGSTMATTEDEDDLAAARRAMKDPQNIPFLIAMFLCEPGVADEFRRIVNTTPDKAQRARMAASYLDSIDNPLSEPLAKQFISAVSEWQ